MPGRVVFDPGQPGLGDIDRKSRSQISDPGDRGYEPVAVGSWLFSPSIDAGVLYDDNIYQTRINRVGSWGARLQPRFVAARTTGIHDTTAYGLLDAKLYPDNTRANAVDGRVGLTHRYEIQRDLVWRFQADYTRRTDDETGYDVLNGLGVTRVYSDPQQVNEFFGSTSIQKTWGRFFVGLGGAVLSTLYEDPKDALGRRVSQDEEDGTVFRAVGRVGYEISPALYAFAEPSINWWNYNASYLDSTGYRIVGGLGSNRISLFKGEVFAGYQEQDFDNAIIELVGGGVFGGRVSWFPTRDLTITATADQTLSVSPSSRSVFAQPEVTNTTGAGLQANWLAMRHIAARAQVGYQRVQYENSVRDDNVWRAGLGLTYMITPRLGMVADYAYTMVDSNIRDESYRRNRVTIGARAQF